MDFGHIQIDEDLDLVHQPSPKQSDSSTKSSALVLDCSEHELRGLL